VAHFWGVELRWGQRIAELPQLAREDVPAGPLDALFDLHIRAIQIFRKILDNPGQNWDETMVLDYPWLAPESRKASRRKIVAHALFHSQRHWAQLSTL